MIYMKRQPKNAMEDMMEKLKPGSFIILKQTQKAPKRYMKQAIKNIENYKRSLKDDQRK